MKDANGVKPRRDSNDEWRDDVHCPFVIRHSSLDFTLRLDAPREACDVFSAWRMIQQ
jgi:hypothetical protein